MVHVIEARYPWNFGSSDANLGSSGCAQSS
jgi:hypothetical protein